MQRVLSFLVLISLSIPLSAQAQDKVPDSGFEKSEKELLKAADEIAQDVAEIRGLPLRADIKKGIKRREELRDVLISKLSEEVSDKDIAAEGAVYQRLGLIPADLDYKKMLLDVLTEQIAGFYDQKTKELYVMQGIPLSLQRPAMAHELFHAIQDQHFDILKLQEPFSSVENSDFALARSALIEGDATIVMFDFALYEAGTLPTGAATSVVDIPMVAGVLKSMSFDDITAIEQMMGSSVGSAQGNVADSALAKAPAIFRELLMFPYFAGMRFVVAARIGKQWSDVDQIYKKAPSSTEHILHPERYFAGDEPVWLDFDASRSIDGWEKIYESVMGEFQTRLFLKTHLGAESTEFATAAEGWGGDRLKAYQKDGRVMVVFLSTWDSIEEAKEFYGALHKTVQSRYGSASIIDATGKFGESKCFLRSEDEERVYVERWGDLVLYVEGAPAKLDANGVETDTTAFKLRDEVFGSMKRVPMQDEIKARTQKAN